MVASKKMATQSLGRASLDFTYLAEDAKDYDAAHAFLLLGSAAWTETRQSLLETSLRSHPRPVYVGGTVDLIQPAQNLFALGLN